MSANKEYMQLLKVAKKQGFEVVRSNAGHYKVRNPITRQMTVLACTPKSGATFKVKRHLENIGVKFA